jgi:hypothetical protein
LNGGSGGSGHNGATGASSAPGSVCSIPSDNDHLIETYPGFSQTRMGSTRTSISKRYESKGSLPSPAGNGGRGGIGGMGGLPGLARIYKLDEDHDEENSEIKLVLDKHGNIGANGSNGIAGSGGQAGCQYKCTRTYVEAKEKGYDDLFWSHSNYWSPLYITCVDSGLSSGSRPSDLNAKGRTSPVPIESLTVQQHKQFLSMLKNLNR